MVLTIYVHGSHHVTCIIYIQFRSHDTSMLHIFLSDMRETKFDLCRKIGQGQPRVLIYINFLEIESPMLHAKLQDHRTSGSGKKYFMVFTIYGHGSHLDHVTMTIYIST